jgi:hypothetical protein
MSFEFTSSIAEAGVTPALQTVEPRRVTPDMCFNPRHGPATP